MSPENKNDIPTAPAVKTEPAVNLDNFHHCFRCGWGEENGAKTKVIGNEKICQNCRRAEVDKEFD